MRNGIMFSSPFPTLATLDSEKYGQCSYWSLFPTGAGVPEELAGWLAVSADPRGWSYSDEDNEAMDETNFAAICDAVDTTDGFGIPEIRSDYRFLRSGNDWVVTGLSDALEHGVAHFGRLLIVAPDNDVAIEGAESCDKALADYPLLDESAYSEREWDAWIQYAPMALSDEIRDSDLDEDTADAILEQSDEVLSAVSQHLHYYYGFSGDYSPSFLSILASAIPTL
jgi:hypothetical protein